MKKTKVAIGVVIALGVVWVGGAWYSGKQIEPHMRDVVNRLNQIIKEKRPGSGIVLSLENYQRGIFSSDARLVVKNTKNTPELDIPAGQHIEFAETIDHGPLPFAQLKRFNLIPAAASIHSEMVKNDSVQALFDMAGGKSPFTIDTRLSYSKVMSNDIDIQPLKYAKNDETLDSKAIQLSVSSDQHLDKVSLSGDIPQLAYSFKNQDGETINLHVEGFETEGDNHLTSENLRIGAHDVSLKNFSYSLNGQPALAISGIKLKSKFDSQNSKLAGDADYTIDAIKLGQQTLGSAQLAFKLSDFNTAAVKKFSDEYNRAVQENLKLMANQTQPDPMLDEKMKQTINQAVWTNLPTLLQGKPKFSIEQLVIKNDKGESRFNLQADFNDPNTVTEAPNSLGGIVDGYIQSLHANLQINQDMAKQFVSVLEQAQGNPQDMANKLAQQQVSGLAAMGEMFHLTKNENNNILSNLAYGQGQVTLNDKKMPLESFIQQYLPFQMAPSPVLSEPDPQLDQ